MIETEFDADNVPASIFLVWRINDETFNRDFIVIWGEYETRDHIAESLKEYLFARVSHVPDLWIDCIPIDETVKKENVLMELREFPSMVELAQIEQSLMEFVESTMRRS